MLRLLVPVMLLSSAVASAAKPDLNAEWKLIAAKSDFGPLPSPESMVRKITDKDGSVTIASKMTLQDQEFTWSATLKTDGSEQSFTMGSSPAKGTMKWEGDKLIFLTKREVDMGDIRQDEEWTVSPDGKMLTIQIKMTLPDGNTPALRMVFERG